jgi:hypothetical protein
VQAKPLGGVERRHAERRHRLDAELDRAADHVIDAALAEQIGGLAVVGAEADPAAVLLGDQREQGVEVAGVGGLTDQDVQAAREFFFRLLDADAFVIGADAAAT